MLKSTNPEKRAHQIMRSLITSGYVLWICNESLGIYVLRHRNGNRFFVDIGQNRDKLIVKKNGKPIEL